MAENLAKHLVGYGDFSVKGEESVYSIVTTSGVVDKLDFHNLE